MTQVRESATKGATETHEPQRSLQQQGRRAAEARATMPDAVITCKVAAADVEHGPNAIIAAFARAIKQTPQANAAYRDAQIERYERVNIGLVLPDGDGSASVTIADADTRSADQIGELRDSLAAKLADRTLTAPDSAGATCSVTDLWATGISSFTAVLTSPHAVALAIGGRQEDGSVALTLTVDLRVVSPHAAAALLDLTARELGK
jgi:pyruvate dehydrogenase E2 component (dihydrolipoamide acetyltransferase)